MSWAAISSNNNNTNDRLLFLYANLIGTSVVVETDKGAVWEGLFGSISNGEVLLQSARLCVTPAIDANAPGYWVDCLKLMYKNVLSISANGTASVPCGQVSLSTVKKVAPQVQTPSAQIDWAADSDDEGTTLEEQEKKYVPGTFDQFGVNQKKFGVKSTYKETDYTTDLNQRRYTAEERARAENLTRDINSQAVRSEAHAIERGLDSNVDEGTLYSDVRRGGGNNNHHKDPVTPSSPSDMGLRNAQPGSWAEQQRLKKAGKLPVPASSTPNTPTAPAPASAGKKSAFAAAASVPVTVSTPTGNNASKPATPNQPSSSTQPSTVPAAAAPVPKKSNLSAGAPAFNVGAAPWTPGGAPVATPSLFADILSGGAIRYTHREINTSLFYWIEQPMQQQQQHQQPPSGHYGGNQRNNNDYGPRGGGGGFGGGGGRGDYNSNQHGGGQQGYVPQVHVAAAHPNQGQLNQGGGGGGHHHHMSHSNHQQHHSYQHQNHQQPPLQHQHQHHHHRDHQQQQQGGGGYGGHSHSYNNNNNGPAPHHHQQQQGPPPQQQQPHDSSNMAPPPPSSHMQQHAPASIGRGGGVSVGNNNANPENAGPVVSSVMRGRGRGRATGGLN